MPDPLPGNEIYSRIPSNLEILNKRDPIDPFDTIDELLEKKGQAARELKKAHDELDMRQWKKGSLKMKEDPNVFSPYNRPVKEFDADILSLDNLIFKIEKRLAEMETK